MKKLLQALVLAATLGGCSGSSTVVQSPTRPQLRAAIDVAKDAWVLTASSCIDAAQITGNSQIVVNCRKALDPAHDLIVAAAQGLDASGTVDLCALQAAMGGIASAANELGAATNPTAAGAVTDALKIVEAVAAGHCASDAGSDGASHD